VGRTRASASGLDRCASKPEKRETPVEEPGPCSKQPNERDPLQKSTSRVENPGDGAHVIPFQRLCAPTAKELADAHRRGRDPNRLLLAFRARYDAAVDAAGRIIDQVAGDDQEQRERLWDECNAIAAARHVEWWITPVVAVTKLLAPQARPQELACVGQRLQRNIRVGFTVSRLPRPARGRPTRTSRITTAGRARSPARRTPKETRAGPDPGDDAGGEPPDGLTFEAFHLATSFLTDSQRLQVHLTLPKEVQDQPWDALGRRSWKEWS
jgi:hypothetical protein